MGAQAGAKDAVQEEKERKASKVDFKMVTFSLAGKEYGIDIMNVKEIAKAGRFTYVPNAAPFVRGVYNLRGDIISVIDLRVMFHLPAQRKEQDALESLLILRVQDHAFGVIVDSIDKVVGIAQEQIQPPHPIFVDINIKYIRGVVENSGKLYIILDIERIFAPKADKSQAEPAVRAPIAAEPDEEAAEEAVGEPDGEVEMSFIRETLAALKGFHASPVNEEWFKGRFAEWKAERPKGELQLKELDDAEQFLNGFDSPCTDRFWDDSYAEAVEAALPAVDSKTVNVWNPGCGKGYETYSFACLLRRKYPQARIKIWANDSDLLAISMAPNLVFDGESAPELVREHLVKVRNGWSFSQQVKDSILFEYHDVLNSSPLPDIDIILCRDLLSFLSGNDQRRLINDFGDKLKVSGAFVSGWNERLSEADGWRRTGDAGVYLRYKE